MLNGVKSLDCDREVIGGREVLEPPLQVANLHGDAGSTCCCTDTPICQSRGRTPQPLRRFGSIAAVVSVDVPNVVWVVAAHSPLAALLVRSH